MARIRTQKAVSRRIDHNYFKRPHPLRTGRQLLFFLAGLVTIALVTFFSVGGDARLHNPGELTSAHAFIQNDCRACHDGGGAGTAGGSAGFSKTVSDASCLSCHDGAIHHHNQTDATVSKWPALAASMTAGARPDPKFAAAADAKLTSKDCVSCHVEHRGEAAMAASHSSLCIDCHGDLSKNAKEPSKIVVSTLITAFEPLKHPNFGRSLVKPGSTELGSAAWTDPTVIKFNHEKHNNIGVLKDNCTSCHAVNDPQVVLNEPSPSLPPPYATIKDRPLDWSRSQDRADMSQISYERHCIGCHAIELPGKFRLPIPHEDLAVVRGFLASVGNQYAQKLSAMPDKSAELTVEIVTGRPPRQKREKKTITELEWVAARLAELSEATDKAFGRDEKFAAIKRAVAPPPAPASTQPATPATPALATGPDVSVLEHLVTFGIGSNCNYCHQVTGEVPAIAFPRTMALPTTAPATAPATATPNTPVIASVPLQLAMTTPTGIPDSPRRWFKNSKFDHNAHRSVGCLDCHSKALTSSATSDVLSPDMTEGAASCISCHKADVPSFTHGPTRGAPADCITCHWFHDPLKERSPDGSLNPLTGLPLPPLRQTTPPTTRPGAAN